MTTTTITRPDSRAEISEDSLTDWLFCHEDHYFSGTRAEARKIARIMLAGPAMLDRLKLISTRWGLEDVDAVFPCGAMRQDVHDLIAIAEGRTA